MCLLPAKDIMAGGSLQDVCDVLCYAYDSNFIDDVEFALLYDCNTSRRLFPYWRFDDFDITTWDEEERHTDLRFQKSDLKLLQNCLRIPEKITCASVHPTEALSISM